MQSAHSPRWRLWNCMLTYGCYGCNLRSWQLVISDCRLPIISFCSQAWKNIINKHSGDTRGKKSFFFFVYFRMLLIIILFCMAFASTFYLVLVEQPRFRSFGLAVLSSFIAMLGDFGYDELFVNVGYHPKFYNFKLIAFIVFVLLMEIALNNVHIGLAVGDTENVINKAKVQRLRELVNRNNRSFFIHRRSVLHE